MTRGDVGAIWLNVARLQEAAGKPDDAKNSRATAKRVKSMNAWMKMTYRR